MNERYDAFIQPAPEPAFREKEVTNGAPKYGATSMDNLGIAFSLTTIRKIIEEMKTEHFRFRPERQQFIPKPNGKMRKLGIPCVNDKILREVIHMILEAVYNSPQGPYFEETSHGFRPHRSCHTALREIRTHWTAVNWYIEGDIRVCFDEGRPFGRQMTRL